MYLDNLMHLIYLRNMLTDGYNAIKNKELFDNYDTSLHCFKITTLYYYTHNDYQYYNEFFKHTSDVKMFLTSSKMHKLLNIIFTRRII